MDGSPATASTAALAAGSSSKPRIMLRHSTSDLPQLRLALPDDPPSNRRAPAPARDGAARPRAVLTPPAPGPAAAHRSSSLNRHSAGAGPNGTGCAAGRPATPRLPRCAGEAGVGAESGRREGGREREREREREVL